MTAAYDTSALDGALLLVKRHCAISEGYRRESMNWKAAYEEAMKKLGDLNAARAVAVAAKKEVASLTDDLDDADEEIENLRRNLDAANAQISAMEADISAKASAFKDDMEAVKAENDGHFKTIGAANARISVLEAELAVNTAAFNEDMEAVEAEKDGLFKTIGAANALIGSLETEFSATAAALKDGLEAVEAEKDAANARIVALETELASGQRKRDPAPAPAEPPAKRAKNEVIRDITYDHVTVGPDGKLIMAVSDDASGPTDIRVRFVDKINPSKRTHRSWYVTTESGTAYCKSFAEVERRLCTAA